MFKYSVFACIIGFLLEILIGEPKFLYHPVRLIGKLIELSEKIFRGIFENNKNGLEFAGVFIVITVCFVTTAVVFLINYFAYGFNIYLGIIIESFLCYFMLATKGLKIESMKVYEKIYKEDIEGGRKAVSMIVGRDTQNLDKEGIIKATVETVAENLSDGVIAPMFYILMGGSIFGAFYKAINTMDSMIGYKNEKYIYLGKCAAKADDLFNFIPARLSALMLILTAFLMKRDYKRAIKIFKRDRFNHKSPNSAQTESVCAGILGIQLGGDAFYFRKLHKKPFIGDCVNKVEEENIIEINKLMYVASFLTIILFGGLKILILAGVFI